MRETLAIEYRESASKPFTDVQDISPRGPCRRAKARRGSRWYLLKGLRPEFVDDPEYLDWLNREYELLSDVVDHPGLPPVVAIEDNSPIGPCVVLDWAEGAQLNQYLSQDRSLADRKAVARGVVYALEHLHINGMSHGDLRPENIRVSPFGNHPWLIDVAIDDNDAYASYVKARGYDEYTPPEFISSGRPVDARGDIYALGIILRDLKLGRRYDWVVKKCTQPNPALRFQSADEIANLIRSGKISHLRNYIFIWLIVAAFIAIVLTIIFASHPPLPTSNAVGELPRTAGF